MATIHQCCPSFRGIKSSISTAGQVPEPWEGWVRITVYKNSLTFPWMVKLFHRFLKNCELFFLKKTLFHDQLSFILQEDGPTRRVGWGRFPGFPKAAKTVYAYTSMSNLQSILWIHAIHIHSYVMCVYVLHVCFVDFPIWKHRSMYICYIYNMISQVSMFTKRDASWIIGMWALGAPQQHLWKIAFLLGRGWFSGANC